MADTEEEQIELLKKWWHENGKAIVIGVVTAIVLFAGWQTWHSHQQARNEAAADIFQQMITATETPDGTVKAAELAEQLRKDYSATVYGVFAALQLAKDAVAANDLPRAATLLEWAQNQNADASLKPLIALRLAKVQFAQGELEKAFASLSGIKDGNAWLVTAAELRGDILQAQNKSDEARESYNAALKALDASGDQEQRANLEIKLSGLAKPGTQP